MCASYEGLGQGGEGGIPTRVHQDFHLTALLVVGWSGRWRVREQALPPASLLPSHFSRTLPAFHACSLEHLVSSHIAHVSGADTQEAF